MFYIKWKKKIMNWNFYQFVSNIYLKSQITKFLVVGLINSAFYIFLYCGFIYLNLNYKLAVLLATLLGSFFSFKTFGKYVFYNENSILFIKFGVIYAVLYFVNISFVYIYFQVLSNYYVAGFFAAVTCTIFSFILNKYYVFKKAA